MKKCRSTRDIKNEEAAKNSRRENMNRRSCNIPVSANSLSLAARGGSRALAMLGDITWWQGGGYIRVVEGSLKPSGRLLEMPRKTTKDTYGGNPKDTSERTT